MPRKRGAIRPNPVPNARAIQTRVVESNGCAECRSNSRVIRCSVSVAEAERIASALRATGDSGADQGLADYFDAHATIATRREHYDEF